MAKKKRKNSNKRPLRWRASPLKGSFMVLAIVGFLVTTYLIYPRSFNYGVTFMIIFAAMFIASLISMSKAPIDERGKGG
ncbi:MAG: hypothetical protein AABX13_00270 [Nanoarchaeota archaeon]